MRTRETHAAHCLSLGGPLHDHYATTFGLHRDSILNTSAYFHVTDGLIPDVMHDCLEGCLPYETKELLKYLFSAHILTLSSLNEAIQSFPFVGADSRNKPSPIAATTMSSADHTLKQSGKKDFFKIVIIHAYSYTNVVPQSLTSTFNWRTSPS